MQSLTFIILILSEKKSQYLSFATYGHLAGWPAIHTATDHYCMQVKNSVTVHIYPFLPFNSTEHGIEILRAGKKQQQTNKKAHQRVSPVTLLSC